MKLSTHLHIDTELCGQVTDLSPGHAKLTFTPSAAMTADEHQLVHGGFLFGAADYAAMAAVNHPYVVLGSADVKFLAPVKLGDLVTFYATVIDVLNKRHVVLLEGRVSDKTVFSGTFTCFVLEKHVLDQ